MSKRRLKAFGTRFAMEMVIVTLGSAIYISLLHSIISKELDANISKRLSNDFNRLGEKWANPVVIRLTTGTTIKNG